MTNLKPCPFCGDEGEKGRQTVTQMQDGNTFDRITCRGCGAMCPERNWNRRAAPADKQGGGLDDAIETFIVNWIDSKEHYPKAEAELRAVLARVAPSVPIGFLLREKESGKRIFVDHAPNGENLADALPSWLPVYAAPQPSEKQVEPESPMKVAADALRRKAELEQAHQDGYRDGFKAAQAMLDKAEQPAEEARGVNLEALKAAARAATPGPWAWDASLDALMAGKDLLMWPNNAVVNSEAWSQRLGACGPRAETQAKENAAHIAAANPAAVMALIERLELAEALLAASQPHGGKERG